MSLRGCLIFAICLFLYIPLNEIRTYFNKSTRYIDTSDGYNKFLLINDMHANPLLRESGQIKNWKMCFHEVNRVYKENLTNFGNYLCDPPIRVCYQILNYIKQVIPNPDFIIWQGDSFPHIPPHLKFDDNYLYTITANLSKHLHSLYPNVPVYPLFGNHDSRPPNQLKANFYAEYYKTLMYKGKFDLFLKDSLKDQFLKGGFYSLKLDKRTHLVILNTLVYYISNEQVNENVENDPLGQFKWFENILINARKSNESVFIVIHFPLGNDENAYTYSNGYRSFFKPVYSRKYLDLLYNYGNVIVGQFMSHTHLDTFRLFPNKHGSPVPGFMAPGISAYEKANEPGFRIYKYEKSTTKRPFKLIDYIQYYFSLDEANYKGYIDFKIEYTFRDAYNLPDLSGQSMEKLFSNLKKANSIVYDKYFNYLNMNIKKNFSYCEPNCKRYMLCTIEYSHPDDYKKCINET